MMGLLITSGFSILAVNELATHEQVYIQQVYYIISMHVTEASMKMVLPPVSKYKIF